MSSLDYPAPLGAAVWKLLRLQVVLWISGFRRAKTRSKIGQIVLVFFFAGIGLGALILSTLVLRFLQQNSITAGIDLSILLDSLPVLIITTGFFITMAASFGVLLQVLYLSNDLDFLVAAPLPTRAVFLSKLIQAVLPNFGLFCLLGLPILFGLGAAQGFNLLYYPLLLLVTATYTLMAAGIASILVMAVVRVIPARRVAEVIGLIGAVFAITISQIGNLTRGLEVGQDQLRGALSFLSTLNQPWLPFTWAGQGLVDIGKGAWISGVFFITLALGLAILLFAGTLLLVERLYYTGWASMQVSAQKKKTASLRNTADRKQPYLLSKWIPSVVRALVVKDVLLMRRDLRNLSNLITPLLFGVIFMIATLRQPPNPNTGWVENADLPDFSLYANISFSFIVSWMLMFNLATTSFSREGKNYWILNAAPLRAGELLTAKFIVAYLPSLFVGAFFTALVFIVRSHPLSALPYALLVIILILAGLNGILVAFSVIGSKMDWEDPRKQGIQGITGCLVLIISLVYLIIALAIFFAPPILWSFFIQGNNWIPEGIGLFFGSAAALSCTFLPLRAVRKRVALIGQPGT